MTYQCQSDMQMLKPHSDKVSICKSRKSTIKIKICSINRMLKGTPSCTIHQTRKPIITCIIRTKGTTTSSN